MRYLNRIQIEQYKGIQNLTVDGFSSINLITGPNQSGKTSLLEALQILLNPADFRHYVAVTGGTSAGLFSSFYKGDIRHRTRIAGELLGETCFTEILSYSPSASENFQGFHYYGYPKHEKEVTTEKEIRFSFLEEQKKPKPPLLPFGVVSDNQKEISLQAIAKDISVREKILSYLSLLDNGYEDFETIDFQHTVIRHSTFGALKSSFFTGGTRHFLKIAEQVAGLKNGLLFIDPIESNIATNTMAEMIQTIYSLCQEKEIQLFATTYSDEVIDEWLELLHFYNRLDLLSVFRMKSHNGEMAVTKFDGNLAYRMRMGREADLRKEFLQAYIF